MEALPHVWRPTHPRAIVGIDAPVDRLPGEEQSDAFGLRRVGNNYGDWLQIDCETPRDVLATAYFAESTRMVAEAAKALGGGPTKRRIKQRAGRTDPPEFSAPPSSTRTISIKGDTQTVYLLALHYNLLPA